MNSAHEVVTSWQDTYIFCLQPNFKDDLWLFMIFAALQVSIAGVKLMSFFINRWARGAKVGSGDEDEENVGDDGASGGISIMGVLTLIAGSLILAAYCEDEPDERTFNVFKAGVYLNTFLFAVALIFICGLVVAFVLDIITRRRGRSITFRMFLGGTIVLSIAAAFFGATGIMGLKYIQEECYDEVELFFKDSENYLMERKQFAEEDIFAYDEKLTKEQLYELYGENMIGDAYMFIEDTAELTDEPLYVYSVVYNTSYTRRKIINKRIKTAEYVQSIANDGKKTISLSVKESDASCFETNGEFDAIDGFLTCKISYSKYNKDFARYEEATGKIVSEGECANKDEDITCKKGSASFPLCCDQFVSEFNKGNRDCHCINAVNDASCNFDKDCMGYDENTLDFSDNEQRKRYCSANSNDAWCEEETIDSVTRWKWDNQCDNRANDPNFKLLGCCQNLSSNKFTRTWKNIGIWEKYDMTPIACRASSVEECLTTSQYFGGCCKSETQHADCETCLKGPVKTDQLTEAEAESNHANACGYSNCLLKQNIFEKQKCCEKAQTTYGFTFAVGTVCEAAINYEACDDKKPSKNTDSLACAATTNECKYGKKCFPACCKGLQFDFSSPAAIEASKSSDCFLRASEMIESTQDYDNELGHYIYHHSGFKGEQENRESCQLNGIIDPKCCNPNHSYGNEDPCYCHANGSGDDRCKIVHHEECLPGNDAYPQCCYDIGNFFGANEFCSCRIKHKPNDNKDCNDGPVDRDIFSFIETCPNPCDDGKVLLDNGSLICETPIFKLSTNL